MTNAEKLAIPNPVPGMEIYQTDNPAGMYVYTQTGWQKLDMNTVSNVTASLPLTCNGGVTPNITLPQASSTQNGYLSSTDWTTFNNKLNSTDMNFAEITYNHGNGTFTMHAGTWEYGNQTTVNVNTSSSFANCLPCIGTTTNYYQSASSGTVQILNVNGLPSIVKILAGGAGYYRVTQYVNVEAVNNGCCTEFEVLVSTNSGVNYTNNHNLSCVTAVGANTRYLCGSSSGIIYLNANDQLMLANRRLEGNDTAMKVFCLTLNVERVK
jgi:hypothetical protein